MKIEDGQAIEVVRSTKAIHDELKYRRYASWSDGAKDMINGAGGKDVRPSRKILLEDYVPTYRTLTRSLTVEAPAASIPSSAVKAEGPDVEPSAELKQKKQKTSHQPEVASTRSSAKTEG